ncbi:hypothetical protein OG552_13725 [Streptomyces sp. NBC_01476]|uniref:hypothetical protein n=1 Tax=Streptomyces sp. NBC_01476 TaxID=2903881 RepID=UPI002E34E05C|nr:hypothetical protein [Streptomyces sp. NBC_01476]
MSKASLGRLTAAGVITVAVALAAVACGPADDSAAPAGKSTGAATDSTGSASAKAPTKAPAKKKDDKPAAKPAFKGDGTFQVGSDIKPGTYRSSGNSDGLCYWERSKDAKGEADSILANDNVTGSSYVTIARTDKFFKSTGCDDWFAVTSAKAGAPKTTMAGDGMFKVGTDIQPGTYKSAGNTDDNCYWERSKDALHGLDSIKANDNVTGTAIVTIGASDAYFKSTGCSTWKKTG